MKTGIKVGDIMTRRVVTVPLETKVYECLRVMSKKDVGSLIIVRGKKAIGIITQRDILDFLVKNKKVIDRKVGDIMRKKLVTVSPSIDIGEAMTIMKNKNIRKLPVLIKGQMVGIITKKDILKIKPELFEILSQKMRIFEEKEKWKRIEATGTDRWVKEGPCQECGASDILYQVGNRYLCAICKNSEGDYKKQEQKERNGKPKITKVTRKSILHFLRRR
jgi:CBS domain-containing protein